jgi:hypothetical protein
MLELHPNNPPPLRNPAIQYTGISTSRTFLKTFWRSHISPPAPPPGIPKHQQAGASITSKKYCSKVIFHFQPSAAPGPSCYLWCQGCWSELNLRPRLQCDSMPVLYLHNQSNAPCLLALPLPPRYEILASRSSPVHSHLDRSGAQDPSWIHL